MAARPAQHADTSRVCHGPHHDFVHLGRLTAFVRMKFPGSEALMLLNISLMLIPDQVTLVPRFVMMARMGWVGTWLPAFIPSLIGLNTGMIFVLRQFFRAIPNDRPALTAAANWVSSGASFCRFPCRFSPCRSC